MAARGEVVSTAGGHPYREPGRMEAPLRCEAVQITAVYDGAVVDVRHVRPGGRGGPYLIGETARCAVAVALGLLPRAEFPLVRAARGGIELRFTEAMAGAIDEGEITTLDALIRRGAARPESDGHSFSWSFPRGARARLRLGDLEFHLRWIDLPARIPRCFALPWMACSSTAAVAALVLCFMALCASIAPPQRPDEAAIRLARPVDVPPSRSPSHHPGRMHPVAAGRGWRRCRCPFHGICCGWICYVAGSRWSSHFVRSRTPEYNILRIGESDPDATPDG